MGYGIYNTRAKEFQFGINAPSKNKAFKQLYKKIGNDAYKWRFTIKKIESRGKNIMSKFAEFNKAINAEQVTKDIAKAKENEYKEVPKGRYAVRFEKMEIGVTGAQAKTPNAPMFKLQARIVGKVNKDGEVVDSGYNKSCVFMNKVIYVANETEKWNTGKAIQTVISFLENIQSATPIVFKDYDQFSDLVLDLAEECEGLEFEIEYDPEGFNSISIKDVWEV